MKNVRELNGHNVVYSESTNSVLMAVWFAPGSIFEYKLDTKICSTLQVNSTHSYLINSMVLSSNEEYMICMVRCFEDPLDYYRIASLDLKEMKFTENHVEAPKGTTSNSQLCISNDRRKARLIADGFIRRCSTKFPMDIAGILSGYIMIDVLYLYAKSTGDIWRFDADEVIQSCK